MFRCFQFLEIDICPIICNKNFLDYALLYRFEIVCSHPGIVVESSIFEQPVPDILVLMIYSKTCLKRPLKDRQNKGLYGKW